jgi:hypothetical protein
MGIVHNRPLLKKELNPANGANFKLRGMGNSSTAALSKRTPLKKNTIDVKPKRHICYERRQVFQPRAVWYCNYDIA